MYNFESNQPIELVIDVYVANFSLLASESQAVIVDISPGDLKKHGGKEQVDRVSVDFTAGILRISSDNDRKRFTFLGGNRSVDITVTLPQGSRVLGFYGSGKAEHGIRHFPRAAGRLQHKNWDGKSTTP